MIWIIIFFIIILISAVLAYRSMRDYEEFPDTQSLNSVFFVGNPQNFSLETLKKLHERFLPQKQFFSLERLYKGKEKALVLFGPRELVQHLPELNLIELEDYLIAGEAILSEDKRVTDVNQVLSWLIEPKNNTKKEIHVSQDLKNLITEDDQKIFLQIVVMPQNGGEVFQSTIRLMVADPDSLDRVDLAKKTENLFEGATGLKRHQDNFSESKKFESFKERTLIPQEVTPFPLSSREIFDILA